MRSASPARGSRHAERAGRGFSGRTRSGVDTSPPTRRVVAGRRWRRARRSSGVTFVMVMQAAQVRDFDDRAASRRLPRPRDGRILVQRQVRSPLVIRRDLASPASPTSTTIEPMLHHTRRLTMRLVPPHDRGRSRTRRPAAFRGALHRTRPSGARCPHLMSVGGPLSRTRRIRRDHQQCAEEGLRTGPRSLDTLCEGTPMPTIDSAPQNLTSHRMWTGALYSQDS